MSFSIVAYFERLEQSLLESRAISGYNVLRYETTLTEGMMRVRADLADGGELELFEDVVLVAPEHIVRVKYSDHWQDAGKLLARRWDAVHHYPGLPNAPHHVHLPDGNVEAMTTVPDITTVLTEIESILKGDSRQHV